MTTNEVTQRIWFFRNKKGLSARELSYRLGKHDGYINKLESKEFNLPGDMLLKIMEELDVSPEEFFSDNYREYSIDSELRKLYEELDEERKQALIKLLSK